MRRSLPPSPSRLTRIYGLGYPRLFHWLSLLVVSGLLLLAAVQHIVSLLLTTIVVPILASIAWYWGRKALDGLTTRIDLSEDRAFPDEAIELRVNVSNGKWLPLAWSEVEVEVPHRLAHGRSSPSACTRERLRWTTSLLGGQEISWRQTLSCRARGAYEIGPVRFRSGDIFGLFPHEMLVPAFVSLLVYPRIVPVDRLGMPLRELTGERGIPRSIYEDATRLMGARDYQPDDPLKSIHWKASARRDHLQTKVYESTTSQTIIFILDVYSFCQKHDEEDFELAVTTVASLANQSHLERCPVGLVANSLPDIRIPVAEGHRQFLTVLEALARLQMRSTAPLHQMIERDGIALPMGATPVVVTPVTPALAALLKTLERGGHSPVVVSIGTGAAPLPAGVPVVQVRSPADLSRRYSEAK